MVNICEVDDVFSIDKNLDSRLGFLQGELYVVDGVDEEHIYARSLAEIQVTSISLGKNEQKSG